MTSFFQSYFRTARSTAGRWSAHPACPTPSPPALRTSGPHPAALNAGILSLQQAAGLSRAWCILMETPGGPWKETTVQNASAR